MTSVKGGKAPIHEYPLPFEVKHQRVSEFYQVRSGSLKRWVLEIYFDFFIIHKVYNFDEWKLDKYMHFECVSLLRT